MYRTADTKLLENWRFVKLGTDPQSVSGQLSTILAQFQVVILTPFSSFLPVQENILKVTECVVQSNIMISVNNWSWSIIGHRFLQFNASSDSHQEVFHLAVLCLLQEFRKRPAFPLWQPTARLRRWGRRIWSIVWLLASPGDGLWWQRPATNRW